MGPRLHRRGDRPGQQRYRRFQRQLHRHDPRRVFNVLLHGLIPVVGALALVPVAAFGVDFGHLGISGLTHPANVAPLICLAWMVLGLIVLGYLAVRDRSPIGETRRVFTEEEPLPQDQERLNR